jgi:putative transcriptional regulator
MAYADAMSSAYHHIALGLDDAMAHAGGEAARGRPHRVVPVDVRSVREKLGLSQSEFASAFGVSVATVRNWEQGRRSPRGAARVLMQVIDQDPAAVRRALSEAGPPVEVR